MITFVPKLVPKPPPILYCTNRVEFGVNADPKDMLLEYLCKSIVAPNVVNWSRASCAVFVPPPKVNFLNPSGVYSLINLFFREKN